MGSHFRRTGAGLAAVVLALVLAAAAAGASGFTVTPLVSDNGVAVYRWDTAQADFVPARGPGGNALKK